MICFRQLLDAMKKRSQYVSITSCRITFWNTYVKTGASKTCEKFRVADIEDALYVDLMERQEILELERIFTETLSGGGEEIDKLGS